VLAIVGGSLIPSAAAQAASGCRNGDPLANVYAPSRLKVMSPCRTVSGTVVYAESEVDGDAHIYLKVDPKYASMLNDGNRRNHRNTLVVEIVPADQPRCSKGQKVKGGTCTGAHLATPKPGRHVAVTGPYVYDKNHGWNEIHPVWQIG
jgi:hypothetical protein